MSEPTRKEVLVFNAALELSSVAEREAYLAKACAGDEPLRQKVEALLRDHVEAEDFFKTGPAGAEETPHAAAQAGPAATITVSLPLTERGGERIGCYKLLEQLGEGGFGVVWMAEQERPVRRRVALKIIKLGMDTKEVLARFEAERQALALMDHPNIARVFDGGATDTGRPYFVMELVKGIPITEYCDAAKLSTRARLDLFIQVCHAVQHAHQKGVIHRDLKPSNILVTVQDDKPVPKVIDFGVAKATQTRLTEKTVFTRFQQWIGTPAYMSPEQAGLGSLDVDTRSDVYSLGVLLYELLTGSTPLGAQNLLSAGYDAIMRTVREEDPAKPSTRLSTLAKEELKVVAAKRSDEPAHLNRLVRGDLDWIVMKALEKDRSRRYETANAFARDVQRYLSDEPVEASPPSATYRLRRLARKHRLAVRVAASLALVLLAATAFSARQAVRANRARVTAEVERQRADEARETAESEKRQADLARDKAESEKRRADAARDLAEGERQRATQAEQTALAARHEASLRLADSLTMHGLQDSANAPLWFATAADAGRDDPVRVQANLLRMSLAAAGNECTPVAAFQQAPNSCDRLFFHPTDTRFLMTQGQNDLPGVACRLWDAATETELQAPRELGDPTAGAWVSTNLLLLGTSQGHVALLSFPDLKVLRQWETGERVTCVDAARDSAHLLAAAGKNLFLWSADQAEMVRAAHPDKVLSAAFARERDSIVTACEDNCARVFPVPGEPIAAKTRLDPLFSPVRHVYHSDRGIPPLLVNHDQVMVTIDGSGRTAPSRFSWYDVTTGKLLFNSQASDRGGISGMSLSPDKKVLAVLAAGGRTFDVAQRKATGVGFDSRIVAVEPKSRRVALAAIGGNISLKDWTGNTPSRTISTIPVSSILSDLAFSASGAYLAVADLGGLVRIYRLPPRATDRTASASAASAARGLPTRKLALNGGGTWGVFTPDSRFVAPMGTMDGETAVTAFQVFDTALGSPAAPAIPLTGSLLSAEFSPDGRFAALATGIKTQRHELQFVEWKTGTQLCPPISLPAEPQSVAYSPDGSCVALHCHDGQVLLFESATGRQVNRAQAYFDPEDYTFQNYQYASGRRSIQFSRDGRSFFTTGNAMPQVWDSATCKVRFDLRGGELCCSVAESPDGKTLAAAYWNGQVRCFDAATGRQAGTVLEHPDQILNVSFSPDGKLMCTCCIDRQTRLWDAQSHKLIHALANTERHAAFTPDGRLLFTVGANGVSPRVFDVLTGLPLMPQSAIPFNLDGWHEHVDISPDGRWAVMGGGTPQAYLALVELGPLAAEAIPARTLTYYELLYGAHADATGIALLTDDQWLAHWQDYRKADPQTDAQAKTFAEPKPSPPGIKLALETVKPILQSQFAAGTAAQVVKLAEPSTGRYFCLESINSFNINTFAAVAELDLMGQDGKPLNRAGWSIAYVDSEELSRENGRAENAIDGNPKTYWHTEWSYAHPTHPHRLVLDLGQSETITSFRYVPRPGTTNVGGYIRGYRIYVGDSLVQTGAGE